MMNKINYIVVTSILMGLFQCFGFNSIESRVDSTLSETLRRINIYDDCKGRPQCNKFCRECASFNNTLFLLKAALISVVRGRFESSNPLQVETLIKETEQVIKGWNSIYRRYFPPEINHEN